MPWQAPEITTLFKGIHHNLSRVRRLKRKSRLTKINPKVLQLPHLKLLSALDTAVTGPASFFQTCYLKLDREWSLIIRSNAELISMAIQNTKTDRSCIKLTKNGAFSRQQRTRLTTDTSWDLTWKTKRTLKQKCLECICRISTTPTTTQTGCQSCKNTKNWWTTKTQLGSHSTTLNSNSDWSKLRTRGLWSGKMWESTTKGKGRLTTMTQMMSMEVRSISTGMID